MEYALKLAPSLQERQIWKRLIWRIRLEQEIKDYPYASFSTYTFEGYRADQPIPSSIWQNYIKRVRQKMAYYNKKPAVLRYCVITELGSENSRPHYHALITSSEHITRPALLLPWHDYSPRSQPEGWTNGEVADVLVLKSSDKRVGSYWARQRQLRAKQKAKRNRATYPNTPEGAARYLAKYMYKDQSGGSSRTLCSRTPMIGLTNGLQFLATAAERTADLCLDEHMRLKRSPEVKEGRMPPPPFLKPEKLFNECNEFHSRAYDRGASGYLYD